MSALLNDTKKRKRDYTCLLSDSHNMTRGTGRKNHLKHQTKSEKNAEKMIEPMDFYMHKRRQTKNT